MQKWIFGLMTVLVPVQGASAGIREQTYLSEPGALSDGHGVFVGANLTFSRHDRQKAKPAFSLKMAGTSRDSSSHELAIGRGLELGLSPDRRLQFSLGGRPISQIEGQRNNLSTLGAIGIGVGVLLVVGAVAIANEVHDVRHEEDDE